MAKVRAKRLRNTDKISRKNDGSLNTNFSGKIPTHIITSLDLFEGGNPL